MNVYVSKRSKYKKCSLSGHEEEKNEEKNECKKWKHYHLFIYRYTVYETYNDSQHELCIIFYLL